MNFHLFGGEKELLRMNEKIVQILDNYWWKYEIGWGTSLIWLKLNLH